MSVDHGYGCRPVPRAMVLLRWRYMVADRRCDLRPAGIRGGRYSTALDVLHIGVGRGDLAVFQVCYGGGTMKGYVAVHKEFNEDHHVIQTIFGAPPGISLEDCKAECQQINKNGFNYKPYPVDEVFGKDFVVN